MAQLEHAAANLVNELRDALLNGQEVLFVARSREEAVESALEIVRRHGEEIDRAYQTYLEGDKVKALELFVSAAKIQEQRKKLADSIHWD